MLMIMNFCRSAPFAATIRFQLVRNMAGRADCAKDESPPCSPANLAKKKCNIEQINALMSSAYFNPECCGNPCYDAMPRFDDLYYRASNKKTRKYQQTWCEPKRLKIEVRPACTYAVDNVPMPESRKRKSRSRDSADPCSAAEDHLNLMKCKDQVRSNKCPRLNMPGCRPSRVPPKCLPERKPSDCQKMCTPYPAYSECVRKDPAPLRAKECGCLEMKGICAPGAPLMPRPKCTE